MSVNESQLPQFSSGLQPIGQMPNPTGLAMPVQKHPLLKLARRMMKNATKPKGKARSGKPGRGISDNQDVHFKKLHKYY